MGPPGGTSRTYFSLPHRELMLLPEGIWYGCKLVLTLPTALREFLSQQEATLGSIVWYKLSKGMCLQVHQKKTFFPSMWTLQVAIFLLTVTTLQASDQEEACTEVQQKLQGLSEAVQALCGSSTPPPTTAQPPVIQQCDCSPAVNWTSVPMTSIGSSQLRHTGTLTYDIPSVIPSGAKEVLVLASVQAGYSGPDRSHYIKIYTQQNHRQYEKYIMLHSFGQNAWSANSDNLWFPMTSGRQVFVEKTYAHTGNIGVYLHAIGYR